MLLLSHTIFINPLPRPHGIVVSSTAHFRIWAEVVSHPGTFRLLFLKNNDFGHTTLSAYCFSHTILESIQFPMGRRVALQELSLTHVIPSATHTPTCRWRPTSSFTRSSGGPLCETSKTNLCICLYYTLLYTILYYYYTHWVFSLRSSEDSSQIVRFMMYVS